MTIIYDTNTPVDTSWTAVFRLKALLKTAGWLVKSSGDGTTYNSSGDQITTNTTGAGGMANSNSWFRIQDPGTVREFCFQASNSIGLWKIKYSASAKFTGGSPSATVTPTATDEAFVVGSSGSFAQWGSSTDNTYRWNAMADNASPYGFYSVGFRLNSIDTPTYDVVLIMDPMVSGTYPVADVDPVVIVAGTAASFFTSLHSQGASQQAWYLKGLTGETFQQVMALAFVASNVNFIPGSAGGLLNQDNRRFAYPLFWSRNLLNGLAPVGWKGMSSLFKWNSARSAVPSAIGLNTARDRICFGDINLPWNGSYPLI